MKLSELKINQSAIIESVGINNQMARRLHELGFIKGQKIVCSNIGLFGSPIAFKLSGTKIALRKKDAQLIGVTL